MALVAILNFEGQDYPILGNHLELYGQDSPKIQQIPFYQIWNLRIRRKRHFVCPGSATHLIQEILKYHCFCFSIKRQWSFCGSHFGLECQDLSEHNKNHSITCVMPELAGNYTLFVILSSLYQERSLFLVFNMASVAILGHNRWIWKSRADPKYHEYHSIRSAKPKLVKNDTS